MCQRLDKLGCLSTFCKCARLSNGSYPPDGPVAGSSPQDGFETPARISASPVDAAKQVWMFSSMPTSLNPAPKLRQDLSIEIPCHYDEEEDDDGDFQSIG